ncbi:putative redox-active protein [Candidatus Methanophagaceae archaeon]|nr:putative redox-active protein [Methanophagales archaeon]
MTEKSEIDREVLDEAYRRGSDYLMRYACAPGVFAAVMDTLGYEDDPAINDVWKAAVGLVGGTGNMAIGTCGAMAGAAMAISYSFDLRKEEPEDMMKMLNVTGVVAEVGKKMQEKYGHIQCQEVQFHLLGKSYRFTNPEAMQEFITLSSENPACKEVTGDLARWTVKKVLEHNPHFSRRKQK